MDRAKAARVISALEREVRKEEKRMSKGRRYRLLQQDIDFCVYMMQRHGEDYEVNFIAVISEVFIRWS